jgi:hypothetical protein
MEMNSEFGRQTVLLIRKGLTLCFFEAISRDGAVFIVVGFFVDYKC